MMASHYAPAKPLRLEAVAAEPGEILIGYGATKGDLYLGDDPATAAAETVILALRTDRGVPLSTAMQPPLASVAPWAEASGLLARDDDRFVLTTRGRLLSNEIFARLV